LKVKKFQQQHYKNPLTGTIYKTRNQQSMQKKFSSVDEMIADDLFLAWFFKKDPQQEKEWKEWLEQNPELQSMANQATVIMSELYIAENNVSQAQVNGAYDKLMTTINEQQSGTPVFKIRSNRKQWWIAAAAAAIIIVAGSLFWMNTDTKNDDVILATDYGQLNQKVLPDGSQVTLNAKSTVTLSQDFGNKDREVWLKGEAFFQVAKSSSQKRFIVHTDKFDIVVTGTKFNAVNRDNKISVYLTEGSVTVITKGGEEVKMVPGDYVEMRDDKLEWKETNHEAVLAWKDKRIDFENITMKEAAKIITEHYGVKVTLADETVAEKKLTGIMPNDNLDVLIRALEVAYSFEITKTSNELIFQEK
jgi:ferric-dicitrate binding protein FerR (iron transport regulator)